MDAELYKWLENNTEPKSKKSDNSKLKKYKDDIVILRDKGYSYKQIQEFLLIIRKFAVSTEAIRKYYIKVSEECEATHMASKEQAHDKLRTTSKQQTDNKKASKEAAESNDSYKHKEKKERSFGEFTKNDPMFQKALEEKKEEKPKASPAKKWKKVADFAFPEERAERVKAIWYALKNEHIYPRDREQLEKEIRSLETPAEREIRVAEILDNDPFLNKKKS